MPNFTEEQVYEAFGITPEGGAPAGDTPDPYGGPGGKEQEAAAPAPDPEGAGRAGPEGAGAPSGKEQEPDAPAAEPGGGTQEQDPAPEGGEDQEGGEGADLTEAQRRDNAARRRREETRAAIDAAVQKAVQEEQEKARQQMADFFAAANLKNTLTGAPITSMEEFSAWKAAFDANQLQKDLKAGRLTPEGLEKAIGRLPAMQKVEQLVQAQDEARRKAEMEAARVRMDAEIAEIGKLDPSIRSVEDLLKMPKAREFYAYVKKGNGFLDAYYLSHREELADRRAEAARQQALNNVRGKEHLAGPGLQRGQGAAQVPADELAMFREFNPGATEAEIQAYYNKYKSKK